MKYETWAKICIFSLLFSFVSFLGSCGKLMYDSHVWKEEQLSQQRRDTSLTGTNSSRQN